MAFFRRPKKSDKIKEVGVQNTGDREYTEATTASASKEQSGLFTLHSLPPEASNALE